MYEAFYGLNEKPFNLTPDPRFLYLSPKHEEAFAHLLYGIQNRCGFIMVSGEIGTGKTTICRSLLRELDSDTEVAFIFNPNLSPEELLRTINEDFAIATVADTVRGLIDELNTYLLKQTAEGKNCVLIIDEAQNLETETLEQVRLLSNLETETEKLLQIVLIGQPELPEKLELPELRQLNQRITARYHLSALNQSETLNYIAFRLQVAGGRKRVRFTRGAVRTIYKISRGTPRIINAICDRALLIGYTKDSRQITPSIIRQAAREVQGDVRNRDLRSKRIRLAASSAAVAIGGVLLAAVFLLSSRPFPTVSDVSSFARSQWERVVAVADDMNALEISSQADADGRGAETLEAEAGSPSAAAPNRMLKVRAAEASGGFAAMLQESQPTLSKVVEAESRAAPEESPNPGTEPPRRQAKAPDTAPEAASSLREAPQEKAPRGQRDAMRGPLSSILKAWDLAAPSDSFPLKSIEDVRGYASSNRLSFVRRPLSMKQAVVINLPFLALVRRGLEESWMTVVAIENGIVRVSSTTNESENLALEEFKSIFSNEVAYIWRDSRTGAMALRARSVGTVVWELQEGLRTLGLLDREPTGDYDAATIEVVSKIQRASGLSVDGIVGPQTRMVLGNWLQEHPVRVLAKPAFSDTARALVLSSSGMVLATQEVASLRPVRDDPAVPRGAPALSKEANGLQGLESAVESSTDPATGGVSLPRAESSRPEEPASDAPEDYETSGLETALGQRQGDEANIVSIEGLEQPGYRPQLEFESAFSEDGITASAGLNVPIVPSDLLQGGR